MTNNLVSKVELIVSCRNLMDADILSKSDPMVVLFIRHGTKDYVEYGRTEIIMNNLNPDFNKAFLVDYYFEEIQQLKFQVFDIDSSSTVLADHDFLGEYKCNLGELVSRASIESLLTGQRGRGKIIIRCSEIDSCKELFTFTFSATTPQKTTWCVFRKRYYPFLELHRCTKSYQFTGEQIANEHHLQFVLAHRTEHLQNRENLQWKPFQVRNWRLCQGDRDRLLRIDYRNWKNSGRGELIGYFYTSVNDLHQHQCLFDYFKFNEPSGNYNNHYSTSVAQATLMAFKVETEYTFIDYISGGTQLHFTVAVDFTASNGPQNNPKSLHYVHENYSRSPRMNQYELAISSVGRIIEDYDYDKMFPAFGFGAKIPPNMQLSHCFPMSFQNNNPFCFRVDGLLHAYQYAVRQVQLFGPTNFAPCIRHVQKFAEAYCDGSQYFVVLIITDGIITDIDKTIDSIVDCSFLPMSIIIVGVGGEDFSAMDLLDCDNGLLRSGMKVAERDIVQFVPLRDYMNSQDSFNNQANLARSVLAELPDQVVGWMRKHNIKPKPLSAATSAQVVPSFGDTRSSFSLPGPSFPEPSAPEFYPIQPPPYSL